MSYIYIIKRGDQILAAKIQKGAIRRWYNQQPQEMPTDDVSITRFNAWDDSRVTFTLDDYLSDPNKQHR
jgi:hypothetical protein